MTLSRRNFFKLGIAGASVAGLGSLGYASSSNEPTVTRLSLSFPKIPKEFIGYKVAFIADIHMGHYLDHEYLANITDIMAKEKADVTLLGGDYVWIEHSILAKSLVRLKTNSFHELNDYELIDASFKWCAKVLSNLKCPDGSFAVLGNHDRWEGSKLCAKYLSTSGIKLLINSRSKITRGNATLSIVGVDDYWTGVPKVDFLNSKKERTELRILLSHNPDYVSEVIKNSSLEFDLALCGHTHAGQIKLPLLGPLIYNVRDHRFMEGLVSLNDDGAPYVFTTRGIGMVEIPIRINCPPEITIITLTP